LTLPYVILPKGVVYTVGGQILPQKWGEAHGRIQYHIAAVDHSRASDKKRLTAPSQGLRLIFN
jgi:hypothetical protein